MFRARDLLVRQRTQCVNALRSHASEYGWTTPKGLSHVAKLIRRVEDPAERLPEEARIILKVLLATMKGLDERSRPWIARSRAG